MEIETSILKQNATVDIKKWKNVFNLGFVTKHHLVPTYLFKGHCGFVMSIHVAR